MLNIKLMDINKIIQEEIMTTVANYPLFGDRLNSISETGEGSSIAFPYKFENTAFDEVHYYFNSPKHEYDVIVNQTDPQAGVWVMQFGTIGGTPDEITNEGRPLQIMATLIQITNDFIDRFSPNALRFKPEKDEEREDDMRRFNMYMQFIKKNMRPEYIVYPYGDYIVIERKIKTKDK